MHRSIRTSWRAWPWPLGTAGQAQDIANRVSFLASDAAHYMTGSELAIDGGIMAGANARY
jgi:NAD(P)-dependent dehydrogenase (short-subunit alcohol dehydrogenase family)